VQQLSQPTGANVAASNNLKGSAALGGDWELEVKIGNVEAPLAFRVETMEAYNAVLTTTDGTQGNNFSYSSSISADGRYMAFYSDASNLVSGDDTVIKACSLKNLGLVAPRTAYSVLGSERSNFLFT
jgi:uncharacterized membrane protein